MNHLQDKGIDRKTPPLQGRGKGWGLSGEQLVTLQNRAREMRNNPTEPELRLWRNLSNSQLGGYKFRRQQVIGRAIVDFVCPSAKLIVEVDGDTHADPEREARRDAYLQGLGFTVLHFTNPDVMRNMDGVLQTISMALEAGKAPPLNGRGLKGSRRGSCWRSRSRGVWGDYSQMVSCSAGSLDTCGPAVPSFRGRVQRRSIFVLSGFASTGRYGDSRGSGSSSLRLA